MVVKSAVLTGFGLFASMDENPSSSNLDSLRELREDIEVIANISVSISAVDETISAISLIPISNQSVRTVIHFGVNSVSSKILVETTASNENICVPDVDGVTCNGEPISRGGPGRLHSPLDVRRLVDQTASPLVDVSNDPGRYLYNYMYYRSLAKGWNSVFIHVPTYDSITKEMQVVLIDQLVSAIMKTNAATLPARSNVYPVIVQV